MNFRQIEAFLTVIACGTTTRTVEILRISQPAVSRLLADLARTTRLKHFERGLGRIRPTAEGLALSEQAQSGVIGLARLCEIGRGTGRDRGCQFFIHRESTE